MFDLFGGLLSGSISHMSAVQQQAAMANAAMRDQTYMLRMDFGQAITRPEMLGRIDGQTRTAPRRMHCTCEGCGAPVQVHEAACSYCTRPAR